MGTPLSEVDSRPRPRIALALGGGGACGLAHIGVLDVLEEEGIDVACIVGTSMGGLVGALSAAGHRARDIREAARRFCFPRAFLLGRVPRWDSVFPSAAEILAQTTFSDLRTPLLLTTTDLELGVQRVLRRGPILPAVRATCTVPGVFAPVDIDGRWLVDGALVNPLPVDVAWMVDPDTVIAVNVGATTSRRVPALDWKLTPFLMQLGRFLPNPATAKVSFDVLARAAEITIARQATLATAMTGPELLVEPELPEMGIRDFDRLDEAVESGRRAGARALPALRELLDAAVLPREGPRVRGFDPVCGMVINSSRSRATATHGRTDYHFCSTNCQEVFVRNPERYVAVALSRPGFPSEPPPPRH